MKNTRFLIALGLTLGVSAYAVAAPCDNSSACENPSSNGTTQAGWVASASGMTGVKALNSVGPSGNAIGSHYFFAATTSNLGATTAKGTISTTGTGTQVIGSFALASSPQAPATVINGGVVNSLLGNQTYFFYV